MNQRGHVVMSTQTNFSCGAIVADTELKTRAAELAGWLKCGTDQGCGGSCVHLRVRRFSSVETPRLISRIIALPAFSTPYKAVLSNVVEASADGRAVLFSFEDNTISPRLPASRFMWLLTGFTQN